MQTDATVHCTYQGADTICNQGDLSNYISLINDPQKLQMIHLPETVCKGGHASEFFSPGYGSHKSEE
jgi:hypothetical protein